MQPRRPSPPPSPSSSPSRTAAASGKGSSAEFVADPGPAFDPKNAPPAPDPTLEEELARLEEWEEAQIRELLTLQGEITHAILSAGPEDDDTWIHTERDLGAIAPPLTRILNRYDMTRAAAAAGDEIILASAVSRYAARNYIKRRRYLEDLREQGPRPVTGREAPPETGPEHDEEWQRTHEAPMAPPALVPKGRR